MTTKVSLFTTCVAILFLNGVIARAQTDWLTFGFDSQRTGYNPQEMILSSQTVPSLQFQWGVNLGAPMTAQPIEANGLVYAATWAGMIYAIDPLAGSVVWSKQLGATQTSCNDFAANGDIVGIIGTPTTDTMNGRVFVVSGDDLLHALDPATGSELANYPFQLLGPANNAPRTFVYGSPTYNPANNSLYLATASVCDIPPYHGQVMRVDVTRALRPGSFAAGLSTAATDQVAEVFGGPVASRLVPSTTRSSLRPATQGVFPRTCSTGTMSFGLASI